MRFNCSEILNNRNAIYGVCAIWIVLFHVYLIVDDVRYLVSLPLSRGNMGVDVFMFFSAIGLSRSIEKHSLRVFYKNRVQRVIIPFLISSILFYIWYDFVAVKDGFTQFLLNASSFNNWIVDDYALWYVAAIIPFYAIYPIVYKADYKTRHISSFAIILLSVVFLFTLYIFNSLPVGIERAFSRIPIFMLGVILSNKIEYIQNKEISPLIILLSVLCFLLIFLPLPPPVMLSRYMYCIATIPFIIVITYLLCLSPKIKRCFDFLGGISLEIYIMHVVITRVFLQYDLFSILPGVWWYIIIPLLSIPASLFLSKISKLSIKYLFK